MGARCLRLPRDTNSALETHPVDRGHSRESTGNCPDEIGTAIPGQKIPGQISPHDGLLPCVAHCSPACDLARLGAFGVAVVGSTTALTLITVAGIPVSNTVSKTGGMFVVANAATSFALFVCGVLLTKQCPRNPIGWLLLAGGLAHATSAVSLPLHNAAGLHGWALSASLLLPLALLLFPTGRLPGKEAQDRGSCRSPMAASTCHHTWSDQQNVLAAPVCVSTQYRGEGDVTGTVTCRQQRGLASPRPQPCRGRTRDAGRAGGRSGAPHRTRRPSR